MSIIDSLKAIAISLSLPLSAAATLSYNDLGVAEALPHQPDTVMQLPAVSVTAIKGGAGHLADEAVTTLTATQIERLDVVNMRQAAQIAPNFYMPSYGSKMTASVYVRGLGTRIDQPVVGLTVDNVPLLNKDNFDFDMADIERMEILRGPQNILYGRNTMAGLINITTRSPLRWQGVRLAAGYGTQNSWRVAAEGAVKICSRLGTSLSYYHTGTDGFWRNSYNNSPAGRERNMALRWKVAWQPSSSTTVENSLYYGTARQNGYPYESAVTGVIAYNDTCFYRRTTLTDGLTVRSRIGNVKVAAIGSFQYIDDNMTLDQDFLPQDYFTLTQKRKEWAVTLDFTAIQRVGSYEWVAGAYGFKRHADMSAPVTFADYGISHLIEDNRNAYSPSYPMRFDDRRLPLLSDFGLPSRGVSLYHESRLMLGSFTLTGGIRWDVEEAAIDWDCHTEATYTIYDLTGATPTVWANRNIDIKERGNLKKSFGRVLPKVSVSYRLPSTLGNVYASFTGGYKAGGYNTQMFSDVLQQQLRAELGLSRLYTIDEIISYDPEMTWNYEVGAHLRPARGLSVDAALFWIECRNQQLTMFPEGLTTGRIMANAGRSRSRGVELSSRWAATPWLDLMASYGFTDARFLDFTNGKADFSGKRVPYAPQNTLYVGAEAHGCLHWRGCNFITFNVNTRGTGSIWWDEANTVRQPFYGLLNASVKAERGPVSLELWADNITNTRYNTFYFVSISNAFLQRGRGMSAGATVRLHFNFD